jgi:hypothetical protein
VIEPIFEADLEQDDGHGSFWPGATAAMDEG